MKENKKILEELYEARKTISLLEDELKETNSGLLQMTLEMDDRVQERSLEIIAANEALEREIAEQKRLQKELRQANKKLKEVDEVKSDFLSKLSHELRTPLSIISEGIAICLDGTAGPLLPKQTKFLTSAQDAIDRVGRLVNDLLDLSRIESGKMILRRRTIDLCEIMDRVYEQYNEKAKKKEIALEKKYPDRSIKLFADEDKMLQIFGNLVTNSLRFTKKRDIITLEIKDGKDYVKCCVSDTGSGINKKDIDKLFTKFEQFGRPGGTGYRGTGLGLTIVKELVEEHGGKVWVESEVKKGTRFYFTLEKVDFPKILIVDDDEEIARLIRTFLDEDNYEIDMCHTGEKALLKVKDKTYAMIILDMHLPGMNGDEVLQELKKNKKTRNIPVLVTSGYLLESSILNKMVEDEIPTLPKPFKRNRLRDIVKDLLSG